jgi:hypothetical protein
MKCITRIMVLALGLALLAGLAAVVPGFRRLAELQPSVQAANRHVFTLDVAVDCRTFVTGPNRGDISFLNGKIFPAGTLPSGAATNDPIQPVNGVAPIGDWLTRGQNAFPFPPEVAEAYSSTPAFFATQYYILNDGRALTVEGYASAALEGAFSITGGIGGFRGAAGDVHGDPPRPLGTNITGCPNFRSRFNFVTVFVPRASND